MLEKGGWAYDAGTPVRGHVASTVLVLPLQSNGEFVVVGSVTGDVPVIQQGQEQGCSFPPGLEITRNRPCLVAGIVSHHIIGNGAGGFFDRVYS